DLPRRYCLGVGFGNLNARRADVRGLGHLDLARIDAGQSHFGCYGRVRFAHRRRRDRGLAGGPRRGLDNVPATHWRDLKAAGEWQWEGRQGGGELGPMAVTNRLPFSLIAAATPDRCGPASRTNAVIRRPSSGAVSPARPPTPRNCRSTPPCRAQSDNGGRRYG